MIHMMHDGLSLLINLGTKKVLLSILFAFYTSINNSYGSECEYQLIVNDYYGEFVVREVEQYRGSLNETLESSRKMIGADLIISSNLFRYRDFFISKPNYKIECISNRVVEGEVRRIHSSAFYGIESDRIQIDILKVFDDEDYVYSFEIISGEKIYDVTDGYIYKAYRKIK